MATEKNDALPQYCLPSELLTNSNDDEKNDQGGKIKSQQKLKDLSLSVVTKNENNITVIQHEYSLTPESSQVNGDIFGGCLHGNRHLRIPESPEFNTSDVSSGDPSSLNKLCLKEKTSLIENNYGTYNSQRPEHINNSSLDCVGDSKFLRDNNSAICEGTLDVRQRKQSLIDKVIAEEDRLQTPCVDEDAFDFQDSVYGSNIAAKFETEDEWEMAMNAASSPNLVTLNVNNNNKVALHSLLIKQNGTTDALRQHIMQVVGESQVTVQYVEENFDVIAKVQVCSMVWMQVLTPLSDRTKDIMAFLKASSNNNVPYIVVTDQPIKDDLPIQADVFVEPLTRDIVERLCFKVKGSASSQSVSPKPYPSVCNFTSTPESTISSASGRNSFGSPSRTQTPPRWCRMEHATKEKQRRERIKDSCDQLRVLLPYVKGRKTDMASILEMTVDYLKIVNSALSQDFHSQVIDIMSSSNAPLDDDLIAMNMSYKKSLQKDQTGMDATSSGKSFQACQQSKVDMKTSKSCKDMNLNKRMVTRSLSRTLTTADGTEVHTPTSNTGKHNAARTVYGNLKNGIMVAKRGCSNTKMGSSDPKKPHIAMTTQDHKTPRLFEAAVLHTAKAENVVEDLPSQNPLYHNFQFPHMFTEGDISANRMFSSGHVSSNDGFAYISHSQINLQSMHNLGDRGEVNNYGNVYFDGPYGTYPYANPQDSNNGHYQGTEYVNPNAILPVTSYTPRVSTFTSGRKFERPSTSNSDMQQGDSADIYNNNNNTMS